MAQSRTRNCEGSCASFMPLPPPPITALTSSGYPTRSASSCSDPGGALASQAGIQAHACMMTCTCPSHLHCTLARNGPATSRRWLHSRVSPPAACVPLGPLHGTPAPRAPEHCSLAPWPQTCRLRGASRQRPAGSRTKQRLYGVGDASPRILPCRSTLGSPSEPALDSPMARMAEAGGPTNAMPCSWHAPVKEGPAIHTSLHFCQAGTHAAGTHARHGLCCGLGAVQAASEVVAADLQKPSSLTGSHSRDAPPWRLSAQQPELSGSAFSSRRIGLGC